MSKTNNIMPFYPRRLFWNTPDFLNWDACIPKPSAYKTKKRSLEKKQVTRALRRTEKMNRGENE